MLLISYAVHLEIHDVCTINQRMKVFFFMFGRIIMYKSRLFGRCYNVIVHKVIIHIRASTLNMTNNNL